MIIYDLLRMRDKPRLGVLPRYGENLGVAHPDLFPVYLGTASYWHRPGEHPTRDRVLRSINRMWRTIQDHPDCFPMPPLISIDLEQGHITEDDVCDVLSWIRHEMPHLSLTVYAPQFAPVRYGAWWAIVPWLIIKGEHTQHRGHDIFKNQQARGKRDFQGRYQSWWDRMRLTAHVQGLVDVVSISLYPPYARPDDEITQRWCLFAAHMIEQSRQLWGADKRLLPWIWNTTGPRKGFAPVGVANWRVMLATLADLGCDRVGVWGSKGDDWTRYVADGYWEALAGKRGEHSDSDDDADEED